MGEKVFLLEEEITRRTGDDMIGGYCRIDFPASQNSRRERAVLGANLLVRTKIGSVPRFICGIAGSNLVSSFIKYKLAIDQSNVGWR